MMKQMINLTLRDYDKGYRRLTETRKSEICATVETLIRQRGELPHTAVILATYGIDVLGNTSAEIISCDGKRTILKR